MPNKIDEIQGDPFPERRKEGDDEPLDFLYIAKNQKYTLLTFILIGVVVGISLAFMLPRYYTVSTTMVAISENGGESNNQVSSIARLAGLDTGSTVNEREIGLLYLNSREFILNFIQKHNLTEILFSDEKLNGDEILQPSQIYEKFEELFSVEEVRNSSAIIVSISWKDAGLAKNWLNWILIDINHLMRERARNTGENSIKYLNKQLSNANDIDVKRSFVGLIKDETQKLMLADIRKEYLFEIIDEPLIPEYPSKPNRKLVFALSVLVGSIIGVFFSLFLEARKTIIRQ